jgi:uncharacterized phiE125 gp8 family phage protein
MAYKVATAPVLEPFTTAYIKTWLKIPASVTVEDTLLDNLIKTAREWAEQTTNKALLTQTIEEYFDCWPCGNLMKLTVSPIQSITSIHYVSGGSYVLWDSANYTNDMVSIPARIVKKASASFPTTDDETPNKIKVTYVAGATAATGIPTTIMQAMLQKIAYMYENREDMPGGANNRQRSADALAMLNRTYL